MQANLVRERHKVPEAVDMRISPRLFLSSEGQEHRTTTVALIDLVHKQLLHMPWGRASRCHLCNSHTPAPSRPHGYSAPTFNKH